MIPVEIIATIAAGLQRGHYVLITPDAQVLVGDIEPLLEYAQGFVELEKLPTTGVTKQ